MDPRPSVVPADWVATYLHDPIADSIDLSVDGSSVAVAYTYTVPAGKRFFWHHLDLMAIDGLSEAAGFMGLAALTNGLTITVVDETGVTLIDITSQNTIKRTVHFGIYAGAEHALDSIGAGDDSLTMHLKIAEGGSAIDLPEGAVISVTVQDDLTGLTEFCMMVQGTLKHA